MGWVHWISWFCGGTFLANAVPHIVNGISGRAFQSPFASPPGRGLSSSMVNVVWGFFNAAVAWLLIFRVGAFEFHSALDVAVAGLGFLLTSMALARGFGRLHGGNLDNPIVRK
ncbi:MAG TPA: hypothetical protein VKB38_07860 [Terracidiphilus sp.]|nr:hypothetical protein [Terracidiphilus sp.]